MTDMRSILDGLAIFERWIPNEKQQCRSEIGILRSGFGLYPEELTPEDRERLCELGWQFEEDEEAWELYL